MKQSLFKLMVGLLVVSCQLVYAQLPKVKLAVPKKPTVVYDRMDVKSIKAKKANVAFVYIVDNPNSFGLDHIKADYELFLNGKPTAKGEDVAFTVPAKTKQEFRLPLEINFLDAFESAGALTKAIVGGKKSVPFQMDMTFKIQVKVLKFDVPITAQGDLPLPKSKSPKKITMKKKKLKL